MRALLNRLTTSNRVDPQGSPQEPTPDKAAILAEIETILRDLELGTNPEIETTFGRASSALDRLRNAKRDMSFYLTVIPNKPPESLVSTKERLTYSFAADSYQVRRGNIREAADEAEKALKKAVANLEKIKERILALKTSIESNPEFSASQQEKASKEISKAKATLAEINRAIKELISKANRQTKRLIHDLPIEYFRSQRKPALTLFQNRLNETARGRIGKDIKSLRAELKKIKAVYEKMTTDASQGIVPTDEIQQERYTRVQTYVKDAKEAASRILSETLNSTNENFPDFTPVYQTLFPTEQPETSILNFVDAFAQNYTRALERQRLAAKENAIGSLNRAEAAFPNELPPIPAAGGELEVLQTALGRYNAILETVNTLLGQARRDLDAAHLSEEDAAEFNGRITAIEERKQTVLETAISTLAERIANQPRDKFLIYLGCVTDIELPEIPSTESEDLEGLSSILESYQEAQNAAQARMRSAQRILSEHSELLTQYENDIASAEAKLEAIATEIQNLERRITVAQTELYKAELQERANRGKPVTPDDLTSAGLSITDIRFPAPPTPLPTTDLGEADPDETHGANKKAEPVWGGRRGAQAADDVAAQQPQQPTVVTTTSTAVTVDKEHESTATTVTGANEAEALPAVPAAAPPQAATTPQAVTPPRATTPTVDSAVLLEAVKDQINKKYSEKNRDHNRLFARPFKRLARKRRKHKELVKLTKRVIDNLSKSGTDTTQQTEILYGLLVLIILERSTERLLFSSTLVGIAHHLIQLYELQDHKKINALTALKKHLTDAKEGMNFQGRKCDLFGAVCGWAQEEEEKDTKIEEAFQKGLSRNG